MADRILAPTKDHRKKYIEWLHVYARDYSRVPIRMAALIDRFIASIIALAQTPANLTEYWVVQDRLEGLSELPDTWYRATETELFDVFDPYFIREAFMPGKDHEDKIILGHLIFGMKEWCRMLGIDGIMECDDPLTLYYVDIGMSLQPHRSSEC